MEIGLHQPQRVEQGAVGRAERLREVVAAGERAQGGQLSAHRIVLVAVTLDGRPVGAEGRLAPLQGDAGREQRPLLVLDVLLQRDPEDGERPLDDLEVDAVPAVDAGHGREKLGDPGHLPAQVVMVSRDDVVAELLDARLPPVPLGLRPGRRGVLVDGLELLTNGVEVEPALPQASPSASEPPQQ